MSDELPRLTDLVNRPFLPLEPLEDFVDSLLSLGEKVYMARTCYPKWKLKHTIGQIGEIYDVYSFTEVLTMKDSGDGMWPESTYVISYSPEKEFKKGCRVFNHIETVIEPKSEEEERLLAGALQEIGDHMAGMALGFRINFMKVIREDFGDFFQELLWDYEIQYSLTGPLLGPALPGWDER
jgi:hypothetical protein